MSGEGVRRILLIHGRDDLARTEADILLRRLGYEPVAVADSPRDGSSSVMEIFERLIDACGVVALLTPDDEGKLKKSRTASAQSRARQNVIFELGYAMGRLGRKRVICLVKGTIEEPSNMAGVLVHKFKSSVHELESALQRDLAQLSPMPVARHHLRMFISTSDPEFLRDAGDLLSRATRVRVIATGINEPLWNYFVKYLIPRCRQNRCSVTIHVADPTSRAVESRLIEEEMGAHAPTLGRTGLEQRLQVMLALAREVPNFVLRLFRNYPTLAYFAIDDDVFTYPYGYARLGTYSPVLWLSRSASEGREMVEFLEEHDRAVAMHAIDPLVDVAQQNALALFFIPSVASPLYEFGSRVLGYDVRRARTLPTELQHEAGDASGFGFHLTLCDVLYFASSADRERIVKEVEYLARYIEPFELTGLEVRGGYPDERTVSIAADDQTGALEILHHELVHRVYRDAKQSNYTLDRKPMLRDPTGPWIARDRAVIERFRAPYILSRYEPHFTLLSNVPTKCRQTVYERLRDDFARSVPHKTTKVDRIAVMSPTDRGRWAIDRELRLA